MAKVELSHSDVKNILYSLALEIDASYEAVRNGDRAAGKTGKEFLDLFNRISDQTGIPGDNYLGNLEYSVFDY